MLDLTPERALIFRITHIDNVAWILANGLHCNSSPVRDPNFVQIGNPDLIAKRPNRRVPIPPGGGLGDYVPFYFTPCSPMLLNIVTGHGGIARRPRREFAGGGDMGVEGIWMNGLGIGRPSPTENTSCSCNACARRIGSHPKV